MSAWVVPIVVAVIGGPLMWMLSRFDKRNTEQHLTNLSTLTGIKEAVDEVRTDVRDVRTEVRDVRQDVREVRERVVNHLEWHADRDA